MLSLLDGDGCSDASLARRDIQTVMEGPPHKLLESVAEDIAAGILEEYARVSGVRILIKKPHVAVGGVVKYLGVHCLLWPSMRGPQCLYPYPVLCTKACLRSPVTLQVFLPMKSLWCSCGGWHTPLPSSEVKAEDRSSAMEGRGLCQESRHCGAQGQSRAAFDAGIEIERRRVGASE